MFNATVVITTEIQRRCPQTDEWIKEMGSMYTMEVYSALRKMKLGQFPESG